MCEPEALRATGLSLEEHQRRTVDNYIELTTIAPRLPWLPVLQSQQLGDYLRHVEMYLEARVDLSEIERVGVGSVCRRQGRGKASRSSRTSSRAGFGFTRSGSRRMA